MCEKAWKRDKHLVERERSRATIHLVEPEALWLASRPLVELFKLGPSVVRPRVRCKGVHVPERRLDSLRMHRRIGLVVHQLLARERCQRQRTEAATGLGESGGGGAPADERRDRRRLLLLTAVYGKQLAEAEQEAAAVAWAEDDTCEEIAGNEQ